MTNYNAPLILSIQLWLLFIHFYPKTMIIIDTTSKYLHDMGNFNVTPPYLLIADECKVQYDKVCKSINIIVKRII